MQQTKPVTTVRLQYKSSLKLRKEEEEQSYRPLISMASPSCCIGKSPFLLLNFMKSLVLSVQAGIAVYFESSESISAPILSGWTGR